MKRWRKVLKALHWKTLWLSLKWWWLGGVKTAQLQDKASPVRNEAEEAVARVVYESNLAPDCVVAGVVRGGPAIILIHTVAMYRSGKPWRDHTGKQMTKGQQECFIGKSYDHAAGKALEWIAMQDGKLSTGMQSGMNRKERRAFDARRRGAR